MSDHPLEIEEIDFDSPDIDALFTDRIDPSFMGLRKRLPNHIRACRIVEAHGYIRKPPKGGRKVCWSLDKKRKLDEVSIKAIRSVIFDFVLASEVQKIIQSYRSEQFGDAFNVAEELLMHPYIVIAVLRNLDSEGRLPRHESWG